MLSATKTHLNSSSVGMTRTIIRSALCLPIRHVSSTKTATHSATHSTTVGHQLDLSNLPLAKNTSMVRLTTKEEAKDGSYLTKPAWSHPDFNKDEMLAVKFDHRPVQSIRDGITYGFMKVLRHTFDFFTGYIEPRDEKHQIEIGKGPNRMTLEKWMTRVVVLESIAGIPGSVAGFLRHLHAMRMFRRDKAFIQTLYDEAYNERMHLLTFLKMAKPRFYTKGLLWMGQGIFANLFFVTYLFSPKTCHRFVGYLEEEAVNTYSRCIKDMELGLCPELSSHPVPQLAKDYWHMGENATMYELIQYIRADEAKHREVNHTFANLKQKGEDRNPFVLEIEEDKRPQPSETLKNHRAHGWERKDLIL